MRRATAERTDGRVSCMIITSGFITTTLQSLRRACIVFHLYLERRDTGQLVARHTF